MVSKQAFSFEELPAEIRIMIYEYVLRSGEGVFVSHSHHRRDRYLQATVNLPRPIVVDWRTTTQIGPYLSRRGTAVLRANKLLYGEALPVIYGERMLKFACGSTLAQFAAETGNGMAYLRTVTLHDGGARGPNAPDVRRAIKALQPAHRLERLIVNFCPTCKLDILIPKLFEGVKSFVSTGATPAARRAKWDMVAFQIYVHELHPVSYGNFRVENGDDVSTLEQEIRETVEKMMVKARKLNALKSTQGVRLAGHQAPIHRLGKRRLHTRRGDVKATARLC